MIRNKYLCSDIAPDTKKEGLYVYGAGLYGKMISNTHLRKYITAYIDRDALRIQQFVNGYGDIFNVCLPASIEMEAGIHKKSSISIIMAIRYNEGYKKILDEICEFLESLTLDVDVYLLDYESVRKNGCTIIDGEQYCIDEEIWLLNSPTFLEHSYSISNRRVTDEYLKELYKEPVEFHLDLSSDQLLLEDYESRYVNHIGGMRRTCGFEEKDDCGKIYVLGDSRVSGMLTEDEDTICSFLQKECIKADMRLKVLNMGISGRSIERIYYQVQHLNLTSDDILIILSGCYEYEGVEPVVNFEVWFQNLYEIDAICKKYGARFLYFHIPPIYELKQKKDESEILELITKTKFVEYKNVDVKSMKEYLRMKCMMHGIVYYDLSEDIEAAKMNVYINVHHFGPNGNYIIAKSILEKLRVSEILAYKDLEEKGASSRQARMAEFEETYIRNKSVEDWIQQVRENYNIDNSDRGETGAIIMNANPFTKGHLALVEYALSKVDRLFVFVLEEDASYFSFKDRMKMVQRNLERYKNVFVLPSGNFIISRNTFPEYFKKDRLQDKKIDMSKDVSIFGKYIAPAFHITRRFVGSEPEDRVTKQYNEQLERILPEYGIIYDCMPRIAVSGKFVSASTVRRLYAEKNFVALQELLPRETLEYLRNEIILVQQ